MKNTKTPSFVKQIPWFSTDTVKFTSLQEKLNDRTDMETWYTRGISAPKVNYYRAGACQNCGAMGHNKKDCTQRIRKIGAKYGGGVITGDDDIKILDRDYDGKRDRWNGFTAQQYRQIQQQYEQIDKIRKQKKASQEEEGLQEIQYQQPQIDIQEKPAPRFLKSKHYQPAPKNLRKREDTVKYLLNLNMNSAYFDPKSRAMNQDPVKELPNKSQFKGQTSFLNSGQMPKFLQIQAFANQYNSKHNVELNAISMPSLTMKVFNKTMEAQKSIITQKTQHLQSLYGENSVEDQRLRSTQEYVQYTLDGRTKPARKLGQSKYLEDNFLGNHTSVWGSWWNQWLGWGFACCHSNIKSSICEGVKGKALSLQKQYRLRRQSLDKKQQQQRLKQKQKKDEIEASQAQKNSYREVQAQVI